MRKFVAFMVALVILCACVVSAGAENFKVKKSDDKKQSVEGDVETSMEGYVIDHISEYISSSPETPQGGTVFETHVDISDDDYQPVDFGDPWGVSPVVTEPIGELIVLEDPEDGLDVETPIGPFCWPPVDPVQPIIPVSPVVPPVQPVTPIFPIDPEQPIEPIHVTWPVIHITWPPIQITWPPIHITWPWIHVVPNEDLEVAIK